MTPNRVTKKRLVTSFQKLTPEMQEEVKAKYPLGFSDAMMRIDKPNGDFFYAVSYETEEIVYLVKIDVKIDDSDKMEKDLFSNDIVEADQIGKADDVVDMESDDEM